MYELLDGQVECVKCAHERWIGYRCVHCGYQPEWEEDLLLVEIVDDERIED